MIIGFVNFDNELIKEVGRLVFMAFFT